MNLKFAHLANIAISRMISLKETFYSSITDGAPPFKVASKRKKNTDFKDEFYLGANPPQLESPVLQYSRPSAKVKAISSTASAPASCMW